MLQYCHCPNFLNPGVNPVKMNHTSNNQEILVKRLGKSNYKVTKNGKFDDRTYGCFGWFKNWRGIRALGYLLKRISHRYKLWEKVLEHTNYCHQACGPQHFKIHVFDFCALFLQVVKFTIFQMWKSWGTSEN